MTARSTTAKMRTRGISLGYNGRTVLSDVSLDIPQGAITALIGPSGCGKSSLLTSLNRLTDMIPRCRVTGEAWLDGMNILSAGCDLISLRRRVGMIFQKPNPFPLSIRRNLELPLHEHGFRDRTERENIIERTLRSVGLWEEVKDRLNSPALGLSGGQQQRLCLARALALEPEVLLMDEPCSALDPISSGVVEELILRLREDYTIVIVTHNLAQARRVADRVAMMWTEAGVGRVVEQGGADKVFDSPQNEITAAYLSGLKG